MSRVPPEVPRFGCCISVPDGGAGSGAGKRLSPGATWSSTSEELSAILNSGLVIAAMWCQRTGGQGGAG